MVRAAMTTLAISTLAWGRAAPAVEIREVRPIQIDYPADTSRAGGETIVLWQADGPFEEVRVTVDGGTAVRILDGAITSTGLGDLLPGKHQVEVQGFQGGAVGSADGAPIEVLPAPPAAGVAADGCLFFAHDPTRGGGFLEFFWINRDTPELPYFDFEISLDGLFRGVLAAPAGSILFSHAPPGPHALEVVAYTRNHLCRPLLLRCDGEVVEPIADPVCRFERCDAGKGRFLLHYALPADPRPDGVAVFDVTAGGAGIHLGNFIPAESPIPIEGVSPGTELAIELVAFRGDSASTVPSAPGDHRTAICSLAADGCRPLPPFRRGDCNDDGRVDISDDIGHLSSLFSGGERPPCIDACDVNDDGGEDISDPIAGLSFKFAGGPLPPPPYGECGPDPTPDGLTCRMSAGCP